jgi:two-component system, LytTR family, response regulator
MKPPKIYKTDFLSPTALLLPFQKGRRWVTFDQIIRLEAIGNYTTCIFADGSELLVALTLKRLEDRIPVDAFARTHKKHLVNRAYVASIQPRQFSVKLTNGDQVQIARRRVETLRSEMRG